jgi:hypothetical protein
VSRGVVFQYGAFYLQKGKRGCCMILIKSTNPTALLNRNVFQEYVGSYLKLNHATEMLPKIKAPVTIKVVCFSRSGKAQNNTVTSFFVKELSRRHLPGD